MKKNKIKILLKSIDTFCGSNIDSQIAVKEFLSKLRKDLSDIHDYYALLKCTHIEDLERLLRSVGKKTFVECYDLYNEHYKDESRQELIRKMRITVKYNNYNSIASKASQGVKIFREGMQIEALRSISNALRVEDEVVIKANQILKTLEQSSLKESKK